MGALDIIRNAFLSPADRRLRQAAIAAEVWQDAAKPSTALARLGPAAAVPFGGGANQPPAPPTKIEWWNDQQPPSPTVYQFRGGYSDHTFQNLSAPTVFEGFDLDRIKNACAMHRLGWFYETSALMVAILGFAPIMAATQQAVAPILALPRHVHGGDKGLAKLVRDEVADALVPDGGLMPSPFFPPQLWGTMAIYLRFLGFCVLQHVDGEEDPDTGVRPRYTRIWEPWATQRWRNPRKVIAYTTEGPQEIRNDGHFTLIEDTNEGHLFDAAILALGDETFAGKLTQEQRLRWQDFFASPKLYATLPEKVPTHGEAGDAFRQAVEDIYGPDGRGILPNGSTLDVAALPGRGPDQFQGTLLDAIVHIFMVMTGSAGTIGNGMSAGAGVPYQPQKGGSWTVRDDLIRRPTIAIVRGVNGGHVQPYQDHNYADAIARARKVGAWKDASLSIPLPDRDRDARVESEVIRYKALTEQVAAEKAVGAIVDQSRVDKLADRFEVLPFTLADKDPKVGEIFQYHIENKLVAPDEARARLGLPALPNGAGSVERLAEERLAGGDETGALAKVDAAQEQAGGPADDAAAEEAEGPPAQRTPPADDDGPGTQRSG